MAPQEQPKMSGEVVVRGEKDKNESMVQPNAEDITNMSMTKQFGEPNSKANPAVSGVAIKGIGQQ